jgi:L-asparaginase/Glu-tRNA(Gln) amidotransferase subunit D
MLPEVAYVKLMWVLENYPGEERDKMLQNLVGEISERRVGIEYV